MNSQAQQTNRATLKSAELSNQVRLQHLEQGDPAGVPVILLHGCTDSCHTFGPVLTHPPPSLRVFAPSQRGHGVSDRPGFGYRFKDFSDDLLAFVHAIGVGAVMRPLAKVG
jgi:pimeloyl-ACP methyl ester carboxylesterase